jgi:hypothetical protein
VTDVTISRARYTLTHIHTLSYTYTHTLSYTYTHTLLLYTPLIHSSYTLLSYTPLIRSSHTLLSYTPLIYSSPTLSPYTPPIHTPLIHPSSHTLPPYIHRLSLHASPQQSQRGRLQCSSHYTSAAHTTPAAGGAADGAGGAGGVGDASDGRPHA